MVQLRWPAAGMALALVVACGSSGFTEFAKQVESPEPCMTEPRCRALKEKAQSYVLECEREKGVWTGHDPCARERQVLSTASANYERTSAPPIPAAVAMSKASASTTAPPPPPVEEPEPPPPAVPSNPVELFQALSKMRPFNSQFIAFEAISNFVNYYAALDKSPEVVEPAAQVRKSIRIFNGYVALPTGIVQLNNMSNDRFKSLAKNGATGRLMADALYDVIQISGALYLRFVIAQKGRLSPDDLQGMQQQVAPGGPEQTNLSTLNDLRQSLTREWMQQSKGGR